MPATRSAVLLGCSKALSENITTLFDLDSSNTSRESTTHGSTSLLTRFISNSFQTRIGDMDGIFVAYHTTQKFLGFQYIPQTEMDERLYGSPEAGDVVFRRCVQTLEHLSHEIINCFPGQDVRVAFEKDDRAEHLRIYVEPDEWDVINMGERPIRKIVVTAASYQYNKHVDGPLPQFSPDCK